MVFCARSGYTRLETSQQRKQILRILVSKFLIVSLKVNERNSIPVTAILVTTIIACLLSLINIGSSVAFNDVVALTINALYTSYLIGNGLLLWRRLRGDIHSPSETEEVSSGSEKLSWGLWRLPEPIGTMNNAFGCVFLLIVLTFSCFPADNHPTPSTMNYVVVMEGGVLIIAIFYYLIWGRKTYTGPIIEVEP